MPKTMSNASWYALHVATGRELEIACMISSQPGCEASAPLAAYYHRHDGLRRDPLFAGYVFVRCAMTHMIYYVLHAIPGVIRLLGVSADGRLPEPIPDTDMWWIEAVRPLLPDYDPATDIYGLVGPMVIGISHGIRRADGRIKIVDGPLKTYEHYIAKIKARQQYAIVELPIGGTVHRLRFGIVVR